MSPESPRVAHARHALRPRHAVAACRAATGRCGSLFVRRSATAARQSQDSAADDAPPRSHPAATRPQKGAPMSSTATAAGATSSRRWLALGLIAAAQFMVIMDTSIIGVALPKMQADLGFTAEGLSWVFNAYVVAFGGLLLLGGRLSDLFGARRIFGIGWTILAAGSLTAGLADNVTVELVGRAVQGAGSALIAPGRPHPAVHHLRQQPEGPHQGPRPLRGGRSRRRHRGRLSRWRAHRVRLLAVGVLHQPAPGRRRPAADERSHARRDDAPRLPRPRRRRNGHHWPGRRGLRDRPRAAGRVDGAVHRARRTRRHRPADRVRRLCRRR